MISIITKAQIKIQNGTDWLLVTHPNIAFISMLIELPLMLLFAVGLTTTAIILPISLLLGWL